MENKKLLEDIYGDIKNKGDINMKDSPYEIMLKSEIIKREKTRTAIPGFYKFVPSLFNVLLLLPHSRGELCDTNNKELVQIQDLFQFYIYDFPFKIKNIISLMEMGSYADAVILFRTLAENFIVYKYFVINNDGIGLSNYYSRKTKKSIKDIFEKVIPGYYDSLYDELGHATHGDPIFQAIFRGNVSKSEPIKSNINNINIDWFSYVFNQLEPIIIGVIELYKKVYPNNTLETSKSVKDDLIAVYNFINNNINDRKKRFPNQSSIINYYNQIIKF